MANNFDVLVIGAGSGGLATAKAASQRGLRVAIAEAQAVGGTCVNRGCVPKKLMLTAATFRRQQQQAIANGWQTTAAFHWPTLRTAMHGHIEHLQQSYQSTLADCHVELMAGQATFLDPHTVAVGDRQVTARTVVLAVGSRPRLLDIPGVELAITSDDVFQLDALPPRLAIIGGGYIGVELSHILHQLGVQVKLVETSAKVLSGFDDALREAAQAGLEQQQIELWLDASCQAIAKTAAGLAVTLTADQPDPTFTVDAVLMAVGRSPNLDGLNLEAAEVERDDQGALIVDDCGQTSQAHIYAIGDCVARLPLTPVAIAEGQAVVQTICTQQPTSVDYRWIPSAVFSQPQLAAAGWTEATARAQLNDDVEVVTHSFTPLPEALQAEKQAAFIKAVVQASTQQVVGLHIAGTDAPELLQGLLPSLKRGLTQADLTATVGIHPTAGEELFALT